MGTHDVARIDFKYYSMIVIFEYIDAQYSQVVIAGRLNLSKYILGTEKSVLLFFRFRKLIGVCIKIISSV